MFEDLSWTSIGFEYIGIGFFTYPNAMGPISIVLFPLWSLKRAKVITSLSVKPSKIFNGHRSGGFLVKKPVRCAWNTAVVRRTHQQLL